MCALCDLDKHASYEEALTSHALNEWLAIMRDEFHG